MKCGSFGLRFPRAPINKHRVPTSRTLQNQTVSRGAPRGGVSLQTTDPWFRSLSPQEPGSPCPSGLSPHQLSSELWGIREGTSRPGPEAQAGSRAVGDQAWEMGLRQLCVSSPVPLFHNPAVFLRFLSFPFKASPGAPALIQAPDLHRQLP